MRVLVDTSVWMDHFHTSDAQLVHLLQHDEVLTHPCVLGELALAGLQGHVIIMSMMAMQSAMVAADAVPRRGKDDTLDPIFAAPDVAELLSEQFPAASEGELARRYNRMVRGETL